MTRKSTPPGRGRAATISVPVAGRLHSAAIHLLRRLRQSDKASGISAPRLSALSVLVYAGPRTLGQLADTEQVRPPTMTRLVQAMEAEGYIKRIPDPHDKRVTVLQATAKARKLLDKARSLRVSTVEEMMKNLTAAEIKTLDAAAKLIEDMAKR